MSNYKLKAINSDHDICNVCGKTSLQKVMWLAELDQDGNENEPFPAGTTCGARLLGVSTRGGHKAVSLRIKDLAYKKISKAQLTLKQNSSLFWLHNNTYLPIDTVIQLRLGKMTMSEALQIRAERYPLVTFFPGCNHMTIDEALSLI